MPGAQFPAAIDTLLAVFVTFLLGGYVGYMRNKWKIQAPATVGHPEFERAFREARLKAFRHSVARLQQASVGASTMPGRSAWLPSDSSW